MYVLFRLGQMRLKSPVERQGVGKESPVHLARHTEQLTKSRLKETNGKEK